MTARHAALLVPSLLLLLAACAGEEGVAGPDFAHGSVTSASVIALGTVQDGGLPHAACGCPRCVTAREKPSRRRTVAALAVSLPRENATFLIDATPDLREQLDALGAGFAEGAVDRAPVDGVLLTHAHIGHYLGLAFFGFEAVHSRGLPVYCSASMARFLRGNGPWSQLVEMGNVTLLELEPGRPIELGEGVTATAWSVPHRDEFAATVGFVLRGSTRSVLYVPDTDSWDAWDPPIESRLEGIDVAILDGTFFSTDELPGRAVGDIGHPLIDASMDRLEPLVAGGVVEVYFTHLNHSNPALDPESPERKEIQRRGFHVLDEGQIFPL